VNYPALLLWGLICLFVFALIFFPFADGYSFDILNTKLKDKPMVCFYKTPPEFKWHTYKAMHLWNDALEEYDYPDRIKYKHIPLIFFVESVDTSCNIHIRFVETVSWGGEELSAWGLAPCSPNMCTIQVSTEARSTVQKVKTIMHEVGHALSLPHIRADNPPEALALPCSNNVMWQFSCSKEMPKVNEMIIRSLECIHAEDGFGGNYNAHCERIVFGKDII